MSRRKNGAFDPDYRKAGWNKSRYAPKNSSMSMSQVAGLFAATAFVAVMGIPAIFPETRSQIWSMAGLAVGVVIAFVVYLISGRIISSREFKQLRKVHGLRTEAELNAPDVKARRASAKVRVHAATEFEHQVAAAMRRLTRHDVVVVGGRGDGGVDIEVRSNGTVIGIVQCKQADERRTLAPAHIRELAAVKTRLGVSIAYLVTTARFSPQAREEASNFGVKLIDGVQLANLRSKADEKIFGQKIELE